MELSIEEKIRLLTGRGMWHTAGIKGEIPEIHLSDGPHGLRKQEDEALTNNDSYESTCYPVAAASVCSWDIGALELMGASIGREAVAAKVSVVLGPGVNIKRSPLCGRNFEYFSEDPLLAGKMGAAFINGVQAQGVGTSLKHFAANSQETHRMTANSQVDERALREIYLQAFEIAVKESKPATIMASYNRLNGQKVTECKELLTDILRKEWGYDGLVVSDWGACCNLTEAVKAGMDLEMPDSLGIHGKKLLNDYKNGKITEAEIDTAVERVLKLVDKYKVRDNTNADISDAHDIALKIALESAVLLKNDGILPLKNKKVAVVGALAETLRFQGGGSSHINTGKVISPLEALEQEGFEVKYAKGYSLSTQNCDAELEKEAENLAKESDIVLFFGGLTDITEGEGYDRTTLEIPKNQRCVYKAIASENKNIVVVSFGGAPFDMSYSSDAKAILHMYLCGEAAGEACVKLLKGEATPSGKLAESWPVSVESTPCYGQFATGSDDIQYRESIFVGYRYYDTFNVPVQYCFGHGLSYTTFEYSNMTLASENYTEGKLSVNIKIKNTGEYPGAEVVQLYVKNPVDSMMRSSRELRAFGRTGILNPGEEQTITLELNERSFSIFEKTTGKFKIIGGRYEIQAASSLNDVRISCDVSVGGEEVPENQREKFADYFSGYAGQLFGEESFRDLYGKPFSHFDTPKKGEYTVVNSIKQLSKGSLLAKIFLMLIKPIIFSMYKGIPHDDPEVLMALSGATEGSVDSAICQSGGIPYKLADSMVLSCNGHRWKAFVKLLEKSDK